MEPNPKFSSRLLEQGIIEMEIVEHSLLQVDDMIAAKAIHNQLGKEQPYCVLVMSANADISREARELAASPDFVQYTQAKAIVVHNTPQRILANLYMKVNRPKIRTKVFDQRETALEWLRTNLPN